MKIKINSFNSKIYLDGTYIDVSPELARSMIERATNIDVDLSFEKFSTKLEYNLQCTSLSLFVLDNRLTITAGPKTVIIQTSDKYKFFPGMTKIFRPL